MQYANVRTSVSFIGVSRVDRLWIVAVVARNALLQGPINFRAQAEAQHVQVQLGRAGEGSHPEPFTANWNSHGAYRVPEWFRDANFGIFIHWGVYSVPAFGNEWYSRMARQPQQSVR